MVSKSATTVISTLSKKLLQRRDKISENIPGNPAQKHIFGSKLAH